MRDVTIVDVAAAAGVSVSTVSRVLNDKADVSSRTSDAVRAAIDALGYTPNNRARDMRRQRSQTIALLFPSRSQRLTTFDLDFVLGAATAADERDYSFSMLTAPLGESQLLSQYRSGAVDGVILMQTLQNDWRIEALRDRDLPFVCIGSTGDPSGLTIVDFDIEGAVDLLVDFLYQLGHRQLALLGRPAGHVEAGVGAAVRLSKAFRTACQRLNLDPISVAAELDQDAAAETTLGIHRQHPEVSAFLTTHGSAAAGAMAALQRSGVAVPEEVSVVGMSTSFIANLISPRLTHVHFPSYDLGYQAAAMLVRRLEQERNGQESEREYHQLSAHLSIGSSTAQRA